ncbi:MerR family transcriptional regulator [Bacillus cereus]|uniref:MerR family transcriptional regulator n=1 Tax=Bacillus cereus TaxID=1396 RepID=UPI001879DF20|nr:MerR family transcriptional regulator [Bacillus cereus]MBE7106612.1 MerR family transcriptional regulator [Bacillus cereus]
MNIKEVAEKTGLTKKAIRYYEEIGLIEIDKDPKNQYRVYGINDLEKLQTIAVLRDLNFSINQIKNILNDKTVFIEELQKIEEKINIDIINIEHKKSQIKVVKENWGSGRSFEEISSLIDPSYLYTDQLHVILRKIFPGPFGEFIGISIHPFLNIKVESVEEINNFKKLINILDNIPPIPKNHPMIEQITNNNINDIATFKEKTQLFYDGIIQNDKIIINNYKEGIKNQINAIKNDEKLRELVSKQNQMAKGLPDLTMESEFSTTLKQLNSNYKKTIENLKQIQSELNKELGFNYQDYLLSL